MELDDAMSADTTTHFNVSTTTIASPYRILDVETSQKLEEMNKIMTTIILLMIMLAMGCSITWQQVWKSVKKPIGIAIGLVSQFVLMPFLAFSLANIFRVKPLHAIGMIVMGSCPGGVMSNLMTFLTQGDVALSVCMTAFSTVIALGMMPLNLFIYTRLWTEERAVIPYVRIVIGLATIIGPVLVGAFIRYALPKVAAVIRIIGAIGGAVLIVFATVLDGLLYPESFHSGWGVIVAGFVMPLTGFLFGYLAAFMFRRSHATCRTIAFETGVQNVGLAFVLVLLTFPRDVVPDILLFVIMYAVSTNVDNYLLAGAYRLWKHCQKDREGEAEITNGHVDEESKQSDNIKTISAGEYPPAFVNLTFDSASEKQIGTSHTSSV